MAAAGLTAETQVIPQDWPGWHVWVTREGKSIVATRTGHPQPSDDPRWARTIIADDWSQLRDDLTEQTALLPARTPQASGHNPGS
jgi:hypothetical protein